MSEPEPEDSQLKQRRGLAGWILQDVDVRLAYLPLLACCFISGLTDGTIYNGNTVFVALGTSGQNNKPYGWARSLCSIVFFVLGSFTFARLYQLLGGRRRGTLTLSFLSQACIVVVAAAMVQGGVIEGRYPSTRSTTRVDFKELIIIALLSFQAAGQIVSSRSVGVGEVPTVVVTSMLCDLVSDRGLFSLSPNEKRARRFCAFVLTLVGAICGGWISKAAQAVGPSLWTVAAIKLVIALLWAAFWRGEETIGGC
ncbi:hypothetical protein L249_0782 [Ophiocordyceps polyrhachis-furcata BCC 54312]|uniref:DUF1275 domain protein n=1 Tax=Ophiocordyceps polyrhachis-furcata BCC 54312 TaxID=1330021 RepID=A0A367LDZ9_9HYPO|nr:hypothetical protein L249_0782 [Ophiocordyceps polyrhachis-furcata BCC 54312]